MFNLLENMAVVRVLLSELKDHRNACLIHMYQNMCFVQERKIMNTLEQFNRRDASDTYYYYYYY